MLMADLRQDAIRTRVQRIDRAVPEKIDALFAEMETVMAASLLGQGVERGALVFQRFADMRYLGQEHTVKVALPAGPITAALLPEIEARFHARHEHTYAFRLASPVELVNCHATAWGRAAKPAIRPVDGRGLRLESALKGRRRVNFDELGFHEAAVYERDRLPVEAALPGPLIVEEPASTSVVFPGQVVRRDAYGMLHIQQSQT
jgi:N-methylhydantoinase A